VVLRSYSEKSVFVDRFSLRLFYHRLNNLRQVITVRQHSDKLLPKTDSFLGFQIGSGRGLDEVWESTQTESARRGMLGALFLGIVLALWCWCEPAQAQGTTAVTSTPGGGGEASAGLGNGPDRDIPQPQAEAAALKQEALAVAREVADAYPKDALTYALLGAAYYNSGQSEEAINYLQKCLELSPGQAEAYEILARAAYEKGRPDEAARLWQEWLNHGPANPDSMNRLGRALMDLGRTEDAIRSLQQAIRLSKASSESYYLLGQAYMQSGDFRQAKESFQQAITLVPDHTQAYFGLYTACMRLSQDEEAGRYREQFQKLEANDRRTLTDRSARSDTLSGLPLVRKTVARTFFGAARLYQAHEQTGKAVELFRRSAILDPDNPTYRAALEAYFSQCNALAEGLAVFERIATDQPENPLNYLFLGRIHGRLDQFEAAERAYRKVQELGPKWAEGYRALADLYLRANRKLPDARVMAARACELEPSGPHFFLLALTCAKNNDRPGAIMAANKALALSPSEGKYQELLKQLKEAP